MNQDQNILISIGKSLSNTPLWVWFIFGYLMFMGIKAIKTRTIYIPRLFILPIVFSGLSHKAFMSGMVSVWVVYFACLFLSAFVSYQYATKQKITLLKESLSVEIPGTYWTLILLMTFFCIKYIFGHISAIDPVLYLKIQNIDIALTGLFAGFFIGRGVCYLVKIKRD